jgi:Ice-binding-like/Bacterial Ig-like domain
MSLLKAGIFFVVLLCLTACGRQVVEFGDEAGTSTAPTVTSTMPVNRATAVAVDTLVSATFSRAMDAGTIDRTTFTVSQRTAKVPGAVTFDALTNTATFTPASSLEPSLIYSVTVSARVTDAAGIPLDANYTWSFTTGDGATDEPPTVIATTPSDEASDVSPDIHLSATFSEAMDGATVTVDTFLLMQDTTPIGGSVTLDPVSNVATFVPDAELEPELVYTATISSDVEDSGGMGLADDYTWTFTTSDSVDMLPPTVTSTVPADEATDVPLVAAISATFSEEMSAATINGTTYTLRRGATNVTGAVELDPSTNTATFTPAAPLLANTLYTATISTGAEDLAGVPLASDYSFTFTTAATAAPAVIASSPVELAINVPLNAQLTATFSEAMDPLTISSTTFTLRRGATNVTGAVTLNPLTNVATFDPTAALVADTVYSATISTGAEDLGGTPLAANYSWSFTTAASIVAPTVTSTSPVNLATNVPINVKPTATFSKAMDPLTITATTFTLARGATNVGGVVTLDALSNTATFTPAAPLLANTVYTATISTGAEDLGGTPLAANYSWSFTTAASIVAPTVTSTSPLNLATGVSINTRPSGTFSAPMDPTTLTDVTFTVRQGLLPVAGSVTYNAGTRTAVFTPNNPLGVNLNYTLTVTTGAKDLGGTPLESDYSWSFTTAACSQAPVVLGAASSFVVLAGSTVTNTGLTVVTGDLGVSPGTAVTGFPPGVLIGTLNAGNPTAAQGIAALTTAYNDAAGRTLCPVTVAGNLGGQTLTPGLYKSTSSLAVSSGDLTLDAQGQGDAIFVFQMATTLTTTVGRQVILTNGAKAANIYWQVGTSATLGTTSVFQGTIMADQAITLGTGATLNGRALARIAAVNLDSNTIVTP